jgi:hypothetical protein
VIITAVAGVILGLLSIGFILLPLIRPTRALTAHRTAEGLLARRDRIYVELRELEFDRTVGKLTAEDYDEARTRLETDAARVLRALDARASTVDDEIEREVRELSANRSVCASCEAPIGPGVNFCPTCGAARSIVARR